MEGKSGKEDDDGWIRNVQRLEQILSTSDISLVAEMKMEEVALHARKDVFN